MNKTEIGSVIVTVVFGVISAVGIKVGWWNMQDVVSYIPQILLSSIPFILAWGFKDRIRKWFSHGKETSNNIISSNSDSITKRIGKPTNIENGIQHYDEREDLPTFNELINSASETIDMSAISYALVILQHSNVINTALKKGIKFTLLTLDKDSNEVDKYIQSLENAKDLKHHITSSLEILCDMKKELKDKDNLIIKVYDSFEKYGIILIDKDKENGLIKIEEYNLDNPNSRRNK